MKRGMVLEGGAMRGMFTTGALDVMMENDIPYDVIVGVSAGAVFGCNYKSRQPGRAIRYNLRFCQDDRYCSTKNLVRTGDLFGAEFCYKDIPDRLDPFDRETYLNNPMDFYVVCTDVRTGKPIYHNCVKGDEEELQWMRASASMPLAARQVKVGGHVLMDGGAADSVPIRFAETLGLDKIVVVLTQPLDFVKGKNKAMPVVRRVYRKNPNLVETMARRHEVYNETTAYLREKELAGEVFVLRPPEALEIGRVEHDPDKLFSVYNLGRVVMKERLDELKAYLEL